MTRSHAATYARSPDQFRSVVQRALRISGYLVTALIIAAALATLYSPESLAQTPPGPRIVEQLVDKLSGNARRFEAAITQAAITLFLSLAAIDVTWTFARHFLGRSDLAETLSEILVYVVSAGVFGWILLNGPEFARAIINSFLQVAGDASSAAGGSRSVSPAATLAIGITLAKSAVAGLSILDPGRSTLLALVAVLVIVIFALIVGRQVQILIEAYFMASVSVILLGFGGSLVTRAYAVSTLRYAIAVGFKLMVMQLLVSSAELIMREWTDGLKSGAAITAEDIAVTMVAAPIVLLVLIESLPHRAQDVINGSSSSTGGALNRAMGGAAAMAGSMAAGMLGGGAAAAAAFKAASAQLDAREAAGGGGTMSGSSPSLGSKIARAAQITGMAAGNLASAGAQDLGQRLTGNYAAQHGHAGWRMAANLNNSAAANRAAAQQTPGAPNAGSAPQSSPGTGGQIGSATGNP